MTKPFLSATEFMRIEQVLIAHYESVLSPDVHHISRVMRPGDDQTVVINETLVIGNGQRRHTKTIAKKSGGEWILLGCEITEPLEGRGQSEASLTKET